MVYRLDKEGHTPGSGSDRPRTGKEKAKQDILAMIRAWNEAEELTQEEVRKWMVEIGEMFQFFHQNQNFMAVLRDSTFPLEIKLREYTKVLNQYRRKLSTRPDIEHVELFKRLLKDNIEQLLGIFMDELNEANAMQREIEFDYDD